MPASDIVLKKWQDLSSELKTDYPPLYWFAYEAKRYPKITGLYPFLSHSRLCLSRCIQYPYFVDYIVTPTSDGDIIISKTDGRGGWVDSKEIGRYRPGTASTELNALIPESYGNAIEGTADELR